MRNATQKEIDKFLQYRANHVALVQRIGKVVFDTDLSDHDKDKIEANGEKLNLFALRNSMINGTYHPHSADKKIINKLASEHVKSQKHHPEYWDDTITIRNFDDGNPPQVNAHKMPKRYLLEMCCDWSAVAIRLNKPIFSWYNKTCVEKDARFLFTDNQKEYIIECLSRIQSKIDSEKLYYPNVTYNAEQVSPKIDFGKKLTESKEDIIYSKEFKDWFGDWENDPEHSSKMVDEEGKPLVCFHGSHAEFDTFEMKYHMNDAGYFGEGYYFTFNKDIKYAEFAEAEARYYGTNIYRCYLNIRNPFNFNQLYMAEDGKKHDVTLALYNLYKTFPEMSSKVKVAQNGKKISLKQYAKLFEDVKSRMYLFQMWNGKYVWHLKLDHEPEDEFERDSYSWVQYDTKNEAIKRKMEELQMFLIDKEGVYLYQFSYYIIQDSELFSELVRKKGYDGIIQSESGDEAIVFYPNQIKSATDNNGNFSKESDNIYEKILHKGNKWMVTDHTGKKNLGTYDTKEEAEKRLKQVEYFKQINESLIDSNNFKKWFGNSVVKDNEGNPLILYHGTPSTTPEITEFDSSKASNNYGEDTLIYATDSKEMAEVFSKDYIEGNLNFTRILTGKKGRVYPLYMRLEHPMDFRNLTDRDIETLTQAYIEYRKDLGENEDNIEEIKNNYKEEIKRNSKFGVDFVKDRHLSYLVHPRYIHIFKENGYDGIICPMEKHGGVEGALEYAVISPNQIKSIDNQGTFSLQSNNIYEKVITSFGGKVPISNKDKDQILKFCKKAVEDGMKPTKYTEEEMANSSNFSSGNIASNTPENNLKLINLGDEELTGLNEAYVVCSLDGRVVSGTYTTDLAKAKEMREELADKYQVFFQLKKVPDKEEKIKESTSNGKTCAFTFGRYQPPTKGHLKVWETLANAEADVHYIYTSHTKDKKKNPLSYNTKVDLINLSLRENNINAEVIESDAKTIIDVIVDIANRGFTDLIFVGGSDRIDDMITLIKKYNDVPNKEGKSYHFDSITGISAGDRDPDSDDLEGVSGTKIRQFALDGDFESFKNNLAFSDADIAKEVMESIKANLK